MNGGLTLGQAVGAALRRDGSSRAILAAGAATSAPGGAQVGWAPITPPREDLTTEASGGDPCAALARLERDLVRSAHNEALGTGAEAQLGNLAVNLAFGLATGLAARRWGPGLLTYGLGWGLGEAQILTEPTGLEDALHRYRAGGLEGGRGGPALAVGWSPLGQLSLRVVF